MDEQSNQLLRDILNQQTKQTALLERNLGRIRFSLRGLLLLMTVMALGLGYVTYSQRQIRASVSAPAGGRPIAVYSAPQRATRQFSQYRGDRYGNPPGSTPASATAAPVDNPFSE